MLDIERGYDRLLLERRLKRARLAPMLGQTVQNISKILKKKDAKIHSDIERVANALDFDVILQFKDRKTGKIIECDLMPDEWDEESTESP